MEKVKKKSWRGWKRLMMKFSLWGKLGGGCESKQWHLKKKLITASFIANDSSVGLFCRSVSFAWMNVCVPVFFVCMSGLMGVGMYTCLYCVPYMSCLLSVCFSVWQSVRLSVCYFVFCLSICLFCLLSVGFVYISVLSAVCFFSWLVWWTLYPQIVDRKERNRNFSD